MIVSKSIRFSGSHFRSVVEAPNDAVRELLFFSEPDEQYRPTSPIGECIGPEELAPHLKKIVHGRPKILLQQMRWRALQFLREIPRPFEQQPAVLRRYMIISFFHSLRRSAIHKRLEFLRPIQDSLQSQPCPFSLVAGRSHFYLFSDLAQLMLPATLNWSANLIRLEPYFSGVLPTVFPEESIV